MSFKTTVMVIGLPDPLFGLGCIVSGNGHGLDVSHGQVILQLLDNERGEIHLAAAGVAQLSRGRHADLSDHRAV